MALNFPDSPSIGDEYEAAGKLWVWTGSTWDAIATGGAGGGGANGFYLYVENDNTNFELVAPQPAGVYYITTQEEDVTYDVYAIASNGDLAGYTNTGRLVATAEFARVTVIGAANDDVVKFETRSTTFTTSDSNINDGAPAYITSVSVTDLESFDDTTVVAGGNFATDVEVYFVGTDAVDRAAKAIVRNSSAELVVTRPDDMPPTHAPYDVKVLNPGIPLPTQAPNQHILPDAITAGAFPVWQTTSPQFWEKGTTTQITLVAADAEGSDIDYAIISGSLFPNFSLEGETGVITGDDTLLEPGTECEFVVRATDSAGNTADRSFSIFIDQVAVNSFYFDPFVDAGSADELLLFDMNL